MSHKYVYEFSEGDGSMRNLLGGKGANLAEMTVLGMPVPPGFCISTEACTRYYADGEKTYIIAPQRLHAGDTIVAGEKVDVKPGNAMPLRSMPVGTIIHNVEMKPGKGAQLARSAGAYAQLVGRDQGYAQIRLGSGELRMVLDGCMAVVGAVSNPEHMNQNLGKAGRKRHMGWRPHVRGVAMNPIDHPHGGGEGRTSGGRTPVTPWGKDTKGTRTRKNKATDKYIIRTRHVKKAR